MATIKDFEDLKIWQMVRELCIEEKKFGELWQKAKNLSQSIGAFIVYSNHSDIKGPKYKNQKVSE